MCPHPLIRALALLLGLASVVATPSPAAPREPESVAPGLPTHESTDIHLTLSRGGQDLFHLHAQRSSTYGSAYTDLEQVTVEVQQGPVPGLVIRSQRGRFIPSSGDFVLEGGVRLEVQDQIELRMERLEYRTDRGSAVSEDPVEVRGEQLTGQARGLELSPSEERLSLLSEVRLRFAKEGRRPRWAELRCGRLDYRLSPPRVECLDGAILSESNRRLEARRLHVDLREEDRRPIAGRAMDGARLSLVLEAAGAPARGGLLRGYASGSTLSLAGEQVELMFDPESGRLQWATATDGGRLQMRPLGELDAERTLDAAWLRIGFRPGQQPGRNLPERLEARGAVVLSWHEPGARGRLEAAELAARWSADASRIEEARLAGGWSLQHTNLLARGDEADVGSAWIELRGEADGYAMLERDGRLLAGLHLRLPRGKGSWSGGGGVQVRRSASAQGTSWSPLGGNGDFWVSAEQFEVDPEVWNWRFEGQVRAWQESNMIESEHLEVQESSRKLRATGQVLTRGVAQAGSEGSGTELVWVRAPELLYAEDRRLAEYRGGVELAHGSSHLTASELDVHLSGQDGRIERVLARGAVRARYPEALGEAERGEYLLGGRRLRLWTPGGTARAMRRDGSESLSGQELTFEGGAGRVTVRSGTHGRSWIILRNEP
ncbi:MAG: LPS export ABC transporter periplasmic protein LptC [Acidobacteriota bacterium]